MRPKPEPHVAALHDSIADERIGLSAVTVREILDGIDRLAPGRRRNDLTGRFRDLLVEMFQDRIVDWTSDDDRQACGEGQRPDPRYSALRVAVTESPEGHPWGPAVVRHVDRADLPQARHQAPGPHPALRSQRTHDQQMHRATARRLGVTRSLSRPQLSDDNPISEAQFKTLKYHPGFPGRFDDIHAAIAFYRSFFAWYCTEHRHGGIAMLTPDDIQSRSCTHRAATT